MQSVDGILAVTFDCFFTPLTNTSKVTLAGSRRVDDKLHKIPLIRAVWLLHLRRGIVVVRYIQEIVVRAEIREDARALGIAANHRQFGVLPACVLYRPSSAM